MRGLNDLNHMGCHFTWTNGSIWSKIDRVLVYSSWFSLQKPAHIHFDNPRAFSDHSPAVVRFDYQLTKGRRNFKFSNMWASHDNFLELISEK